MHLSPTSKLGYLSFNQSINQPISALCFFFGLLFVSSAAKSNSDASYPETKYGNKLMVSIFSKTFSKEFDFSLTFTVFREFP